MSVNNILVSTHVSSSTVILVNQTEEAELIFLIHSISLISVSIF
ncbi:MAG: hypothetical protein Q8S84_04440 [bacterium]|nr:hypothetical protein [bacterium]MDP3380753.1 hypothetical protein [bacterium]